MRLKRKKNIAVIPLLVITIAVWGTITYNIIIRFTGNKTGENEIINDPLSQKTVNIKNTDNPAGEEILYEELDRDPFSIYKPGRKKQEVSTAAAEIKPLAAPPEKPKFNFSISGVIVNNKSRLVILNDAENGGTVFLREGAEYKGLEIKSVDVNKVVIIENKKSREIHVTK